MPRPCEQNNALLNYSVYPEAQVKASGRMHKAATVGRAFIVRKVDSESSYLAPGDYTGGLMATGSRGFMV
jgi:hypothetical protein